MLPVVVLTTPTKPTHDYAPSSLQDDAERAKRNVIALGLASLGFVSLGLPEGLLGVAWPSIRAAFDLPIDALGLLFATFATGYFVSSAFSGRVLARFGVGQALAASCAMTGLSLLGYALSPAWLSMVALGGVLGLGAGTIDAGLNTYAAMKHGSRVLNWMHAAFGLGAAVGPLLMTSVINAGLSWTIGYVIVAVLQLFLATGYAVMRQRFAAPVVARQSAEQVQRVPSGDSALWRNRVIWLTALLFFVYVGIEASAGQWSFSLLTLARDTPTTIAGVLISAYWGGLTVGRLVFGAIADRVSSDTLLRGCMIATVVAAALVWLNVPFVSWGALAVLGFVLAPVFPVLIADTPMRLGLSKTADAVGLQVAAGMLGGAALPSGIGVLAARVGLEVIGACLLGLALVQLVLHEALIRSGPLARHHEMRDPEAAQG